MGRVSVEEQLKTIFDKDYNDLLRDLIKKGFEPEEISNYIKTTFNINVKKATVKIHIARLKNEGTGPKKSAKTLLAEKGVDYKSLLESLSHLTKDEISETIEKDYGVKILPSTIYQYALKYDIKIAAKKSRRKKTPTDLQYLESDLQDKHNKDLLINKFPLPPKRFHPTKHSGFVIYKDIDAIIELCAALTIENTRKANVKLWLKVFKNDLIEETNPIFTCSVPKEKLDGIDEHNYVKICKEVCSDEINKLQDLSVPRLRSTLLVHCKDQKSMENLLSQCHTPTQKA